MNIEIELERVIEKNKNKTFATFEIRIADMAQDCLTEIRKLKAEIALLKEEI